MEFSILRNQNFTSIEIQKKMEEFDEKMKTHVSKISLGSQPLIYPSRNMKSHLDLQRGETQNIKIGFSPQIQFNESFMCVSSDLKITE